MFSCIIDVDIDGNPIRSKIEMIVFDLDDTLVPTKIQILHAYDTLMGYMMSNMPQSYPIAKDTWKDIVQK